MNRKRKILAGALTAALLLTLSIPAFATSGDVAGAVEQTWTSAQGQIKTVVNNVVFPVLDVILAVLFFVKVGASSTLTTGSMPSSSSPAQPSCSPVCCSL